jgi:O-antigen/teichoic acid export membrane protein
MAEMIRQRLNFIPWLLERPEANFKVNLIALGATLVLGLWLINSFCHLGVACGILACNIGASTVILVIFAKLVNFPDGRQTK